MSHERQSGVEGLTAYQVDRVIQMNHSLGANSAVREALVVFKPPFTATFKNNKDQAVSFTIVSFAAAHAIEEMPARLYRRLDEAGLKDVADDVIFEYKRENQIASVEIPKPFEQAFHEKGKTPK